MNYIQEVHIEVVFYFKIIYSYNCQNNYLSITNGSINIKKNKEIEIDGKFNSEFNLNEDNIFTMDIYRSHFNKNASDAQMVFVGRITAVVALIIAIIIAPQLGSLGQVFIFIQEYTGVVSPGILAVFLMGLFYKKATNKFKQSKQQFFNI